MKTSPNTTRHTFVLEGDILPIVIRRHPTSRRITLRYQPVQHSLSVTLPRYASLRQGLHFIEEKRMWIAGQIKGHTGKIPFSDGQALSILGKPYRLSFCGGRGVVHTEDEALIIPGQESFMARRVRDWIIAQAKREITSLAQEKADRLGKKAEKISLRDTVSRWGSCSHRGHLSFSWRLALAPYEVLDYVVAHEVAHLVELNHSPAFWRTVALLCPDYARWRGWIKRYGGQLYRYG